MSGAHHILLSVLAVLLPVITNGQSTISPSRVIESIVPAGDADLNYDDLYENIAQLTTNPLDINSVTKDALLALGMLTDRQAQSIIDYRESNGDLIELFELQSVPTLDLSTIHELLPFVTIRSSAPGKKLFERIRSQQNTYFFTRYERTMELARGYQRDNDSSSSYRGAPGRVYTRFRTTSHGDLSAGLTAEKDAGEKLEWNKQHHGFDFYSGHIQLINKGPVVNAIAGDYTAQFGQGLTLGGGFGIGKGSETITTLRRSSTGFIPYSSANEAGFFRGGAMSIAFPASIMAHTFFSSLARDGSADLTGNETSLAVLQSGKHRTIHEMDGRHTIQEKNFGGAIEYKGHSIDAGVVFHRTLFNRPINKSPTIYNSFDFAGNSNNNIGVFANYNFENVSFFGEASQTIGHGRGWILGAIGSINRSIDVSLLLRHYAKDYYTFYSNAISESTSPKNENGIYWGWKQALTRKLSYTAYVDLFSFPWLRFRSYSPSNGNESLVRFNYKYSKGMDFFLQFRDERKTRNISSDRETYTASTADRRNCIIGTGLTIGKLSIRSRVQFSSYRQWQTTHGFALAFDAGYDWNRFSVAGRFAVFDTDDFDNRQYMNERDVLMAFSFPAYYGEGTRSYVVVRYQAAKWMDLWVKLSETAWFNTISSGSGGDTIDGSKRHDVKVQVVFRFG